MSRTSEEAVKAVLMKDYDSVNEPDLSPFIDTASSLVDDISTAADEAAVTATAGRLEIIERWLAAHLYCCSDKPYESRSTDGASAKFQGKTGMGFNSTMYGQNALQLDPTGHLSTISASSDSSSGGGGRAIARAFSLDTDYTTTDLE